VIEPRTTIPIVFVIGEDPVEVDLVRTLNQPGGNVTGLSNFMNLLGAATAEGDLQVCRSADRRTGRLRPERIRWEPFHA
jgi:ABC transporter substrate binding protein